MYETITADNVVMYAIRHYSNPQCEGEKEFEDDLKRFKYIKRLLIFLHNVFGTTACVTLLLYKIQEEYWPVLKAFLIFLNSITDKELKHIEENKEVLDILRKV